MTDLHHPASTTRAPGFEHPAGHAGEPGRTGDPSDEARRAAHEMAQAGREQARSYIEEHRFTAADRIHGVAEALRSTARDLEGRDGQSSRFTLGAAERADRLAALLRERDADSLLVEARALARRSPAMFVGGAVTAGLLLGRFLKSSATREHDGGDAHDGGERDRETHPTPPPGTRPWGAEPSGEGTVSNMGTNAGRSHDG